MGAYTVLLVIAVTSAVQARRSDHDDPLAPYRHRDGGPDEDQDGGGMGGYGFPWELGLGLGLGLKESELELLRSRLMAGDHVPRREREDLPKDKSLLPDSLWSGFFPGTKWCGPGNKADWDDDLGTNKKTDSCCRQHDHCQDVVEPKQCKHSICNNSTYITMSHCDCDEEFRSCLQMANTAVSNQVGYLYFNLGAMRCFRLESPVKKCLKLSGPLHTRCESYAFDTKRPKQWQVFDQPKY